MDDYTPRDTDGSGMPDFAAIIAALTGGGPRPTAEQRTAEHRRVFGEVLGFTGDTLDFMVRIMDPAMTPDVQKDDLTVEEIVRVAVGEYCRASLTSLGRHVSMAEAQGVPAAAAVNMTTLPGQVALLKDAWTLTCEVTAPEVEVPDDVSSLVD